MSTFDVPVHDVDVAPPGPFWDTDVDDVLADDTEDVGTPVVRLPEGPLVYCEDVGVVIPS